LGSSIGHSNSADEDLESARNYTVTGYNSSHAAVNGYPILTRDMARYRSYFPTVRLITPADA
jgi:hypothetical protein